MFEKLKQRLSARAIRLHADRRGELDAAGVGMGLAVVGGFVAVAGLLGVIFVSVTLFPIVYAEWFAAIGIVLLISGAIVEKAGSQ